jgi:hypothetical protein
MRWPADSISEKLPQAYAVAREVISPYGDVLLAGKSI